jgi:predicted dehydrogenase
VSDPNELFKNLGKSNALAIATRHSLHFNYIRKAIEAGYTNIFVEKPMVTSREELWDLRALRAKTDINIMVGYNRRYSSHAKQTRGFFENDHITNVSYIVNAGFVPRDHWVFENKEGRSRVVGEMCHFFDFFQYITGAKIAEVTVNSISPANEKELLKDNMTVVCAMNNGSVCNLAYYATGDRGLGRENIYIFGSGKSVHINNFSKTRFYSHEKSFTKNTLGQSIGYSEEITEFIKMIHGQAETQSFDDLCNVMDVCFTVEDILGGVKT